MLTEKNILTYVSAYRNEMYFIEVDEEKSKIFLHVLPLIKCSSIPKNPPTNMQQNRN